MTTVSYLRAKHLADLSHLSLSVSLGSFQCKLLYWGEVMPGAWRNYLHSHSFVEVCYAFDGRGTFHIYGSDYLVQSGDVFVAKPGEAHQIESSASDALGIYFWAHTLAHESDCGSESDAIDDLLGTFLASPISIRSAMPGIPLTLDLLADEVARHELAHREAIRALTIKLLIDTCRAVTDTSVESGPIELKGPSTAELVVQTVIRYLRDNYERTISTRDIAAQVHLSERHMSRLFRQVTGKPPMEYLTSIRLHLAEELLLSSDLSIKEVACRCGYRDIQYFTALFHRYTGLPPGRFRSQGGTHFLGTQSQQNVPD